MSKLLFFKPSDGDAALGVFFDGFSKIIIAASILSGMMAMPSSIVYGKIMPAVGLSTALLYLFSCWQAHQLNKAESRNTVTALPVGPQAGRIFVWLFAIMGPVYWETGDAMLAWHVGIAANFVGAFIYMVGGLAAPYLSRVIPTGALFGALAGGAVTWLTLMSLPDMFSLPVVGFASLFVLLVIYLADIRIPVPAALVAITIGTVIAWFSGAMSFDAVKEASSSIGISLPFFYFGFLKSEVISTMMAFLPIIVVFSFGEALSTLQSVEQGRSNGDNFNIKETLLACGIANLLASIIGSPFALGGYWGHAAWKKINATANYPLITAAMYVVFCFLGIVAILSAIIPAQATLGLLVFIGIASAGNAFEVTEKKYYAATALAMSIPILELVKNKMGDMIRPLGDIDLTLLPENIQTIVSTLKVPDAIVLLGNGAPFTALVWGSIFCFMVDRNWLGGAISALVGAVLSFLGMIHLNAIIGTTEAATFMAHLLHPMTIAYLATAIAFVMISFVMPNIKGQTHATAE